MPVVLLPVKGSRIHAPGTVEAWMARATTLRGFVLAAGFLPGGYGGEGPDVAHLGAAVDLLHQLVVEVVRGLVVVSCPQDVFCGVGEVPAGEVRGRVGLDPGDAV